MLFSKCLIGKKLISFAQNEAILDEWDHLGALCQMCLKRVEEIYFLFPKQTNKQTSKK